MHFQMERGRIYLMQEGKLLAELTYTDEGDYYNVDHTFVDECLRGQGVAAQLMAAYQRNNAKVQRRALMLLNGRKNIRNMLRTGCSKKANFAFL